MVIVYLSIALLFFSTMEVISKPFMEIIDPFFLTFVRFLIGGSFLMIWVRKKVEFKDVLFLSLIGSINSILSMTLLQLSVKYGNASTAATLIAMNPLFVSLFSPFIAKEKFVLRRFIGLLTGLVGLLVFAQGMVIGDTPFGILTGIASSVTFALYTVLMKKFVSKYDSITATAYSMLFSSIIYGFFLASLGFLKIPPLNLPNSLFFVYAGIGVTGIAYFTFFKAVEKIGATNSSRIFYLKPVLATILSLLFLGEKLGFLKILGMIIIIFSLMI